MWCGYSTEFTWLTLSLVPSRPNFVGKKKKLGRLDTRLAHSHKSRHKLTSLQYDPHPLVVLEAITLCESNTTIYMSLNIYSYIHVVSSLGSLADITDKKVGSRVGTRLSLAMYLSYYTYMYPVNLFACWKKLAVAFFSNMQKKCGSGDWVRGYIGLHKFIIKAMCSKTSPIASSYLRNIPQP